MNFNNQGIREMSMKALVAMFVAAELSKISKPIKLNRTLEEEYELIKAKQSDLSAKERRAVVYEYERLKEKELEK